MPMARSSSEPCTSPYGAVVGDAKGDRPGFTGHVSDSVTGLTYMQQRYYDPQIGGFLSVDPVAASSGSVAGFNRYRYANGNPYGFTDPDGRESCTVGTRICMSEKALRAKIDKLNEVSPTQSNASKEAAVQAFASNARPCKQLQIERYRRTWKNVIVRTIEFLIIPSVREMGQEIMPRSRRIRATISCQASSMRIRNVKRAPISCQVLVHPVGMGNSWTLGLLMAVTLPLPLRRA